LKKLAMLAAILTLVLLVAIPAIAQVTLEGTQEIDDTGTVEGTLTVEGSGNNSDQCVSPLQFGNTGNEQNERLRLEYASPVGDDISVSHSFDVTPSLSNTCEQTVQQAAAAG
jgi:hypothetical protein